MWRWIKTFVVAGLVFSSFLLSSCTTMTLSYEAQLEVDQRGPADYELMKSYDTTGLALSCWLTGIFYGGSCWAYLLLPFESDQTAIRRDANNQLQALLGPNYHINSDNVSRVGFYSQMSQHRISYEEPDSPHNSSRIANRTSKSPVAPLSSATALPTQKNRPVTPEEFESHIRDTNPSSADSAARSSGFPMGWPEKWFYETENYKYWTVVGEKSLNQSEAMVSSKKKADELIETEFPDLNALNYETTHNEVRQVGNKYESWRVIRLPQKVIAMQGRSPRNY